MDDLELFSLGKHEHLWRLLGAHIFEGSGVEDSAAQGSASVTGVRFAVWAPRAVAVSVIGDFNQWMSDRHPLKRIGDSGVWELIVTGVCPGERYNFEVTSADGRSVQRADPFAFAAEISPSTASIVLDSRHVWADAEWMASRRQNSLRNRPFSVYEVHASSWRDAGIKGSTPMSAFRRLAEELPDYVADMGFTHVELLPITEHPYGGSWGYQVTGYFAASSRFGTADELKDLIDALHARGIGVIIDWVPAHFARDEWALANFDGEPLFEYSDPRQGVHPVWGTLVFDLARPEVRNFLLASALYWLEEFHVDGLRVDAVASMIYLDYSRGPGQWVPNEHGGRENLQGISFLRELNETVARLHPDVVTIAEESTAWQGVSRSDGEGGLGFGFKWNMGWMYDTLRYLAHVPSERVHHLNDVTFGLVYAFDEHFMLPLSHDEVVPEAESLYRRMPGARPQKLASLRALYGWMWAHPGKKLLFMGDEFAQVEQWSHQRQLDWQLLESPQHGGVQQLVRTLNRLYASIASLWEIDADPSGFRWVDPSSGGNNVFSFLRSDASGHSSLLCAANFSDHNHDCYRIGLPHAGVWRQVLNTDDEQFGGASPPGSDRLEVHADPFHGLGASVDLRLPAHSVLWLLADQVDR